MTTRGIPRTAAIVAILTLFACFAQAGAKTDSTQPAVVAVFSLKGTVTETPKADDALFGTGSSESLKDLIVRMQKAAEDDSVKGVVIQYGSASLGLAQLEEIRDVMDAIKTAGKDIYAHEESLTTGSYALLSGASRISVVPTGDLWINGLYSESPYLRGLLDKIGVTPDYLTCGDYKSAAELFTRESPSPEAERMQNWLLDSSFESVLKQIAKGRGITIEKARAWIDQGLYSADGAKNAGIIDAVEYHQDFVAMLKEKYGDNVKFDKKYGKPKGTTVDLSSPFGMLQLWAELLQGPKRAKAGKQSIAIVYVDGPIMPGKPGGSPFDALTGGEIAYSTPIRKALEEVANDDTIKGVVLRVNSPGGSVVASEIILEATKRVRDKKPFVVSMGDVAGSGGYYVACGSDTIFADATSITGSIGVVAGKFATTGLWDKVGVNWKSYKRGENAGLLGSESTFTKGQRKQLQGWMDEVYEIFKGHVVASRGERLAKDINELAGGRVYTGEQALKLGLIDKIGGLDEAIEHIASKADIKDYEVRVVPRPKNFLEVLMSDISGTDQDEKTLSLSTAFGAARGDNSLFQAVEPMLRQLDPHKVDAVRRALGQLQILQSERVIMMMPVIDIRG